MYACACFLYQSINFGDHSSSLSDRCSCALPEPLTSPNAAYNVFEYAQQQKSAPTEPQDYLMPQSNASRAGAAEDDDGASEYIVMFDNQNQELNK